ncbi:hypothetical protein Bxe_A3774 [Paraburkholderia xenovorans LB400]|jgi:hypothetical protein|uniref:Uncharacterized protein n=1 Tax=Paraburkholderia xenovorans (strain LB400) TaxID=266265 RepID=Q144L5_PARXL|nr:hypothetical protein Bxe_A3774 [Paraburkholderia xenovorans LB400]
MFNLIEYNSLRFNLEFSIDRSKDVGRIKIFGWICCRADIFKLVVYLDQAVFYAPVGFPRPDVFKAINPDRRYPFMNSYFCGVDSTFNFPAESLSNASGLTCRASMSDKRDMIFADVPFEFDSNDEASLHA